MKHLLSMLSLLLLPSLVGCQTGKQATPAQPGADLLVNHVEARRYGYRVLWSSNLDMTEGDRIVHAKVLGDLVVTVGSKSRMVSAVSLKTGMPLWRVQVGRKQDRLFAPFRDKNYVYINTTMEVYAIDIERGRLAVISELAHAVTTAPTVVGSMAVFGSIDGRVFAHDIRAGFKKWAYGMSGGIVTKPVACGPSVFVGDTRGTYALLSHDGNLLWRGYTYGPITAQPVASDTVVYCPSQDTKIYALTRREGRDKWTYPTTVKLTADPTLIGNLLFQPLPDGSVLAIDTTKGEKQWQIKTNAKLVGMFKGNILLFNGKELILRNPKDGEIADTIPTKPLDFVFIGPESELIAVTADGKLMMMKPE